MTGTPVENNLTELWAILDWATPGLLGSRHAFRKRVGRPVESGVDPAVTRQFAELISPFLLRRRKSDPGIAPELPAKTETDHPLGLTREQVVLYEAFVKDTMERIERADPADQATRRGLVLALLTGLKQICNHPAHFLKQSGAVRLTGPLGEARPARRAARHGPRRGRRGAGLHPVRRDGAAARGTPAETRRPAPVPARRHAGPRSARRWWRRSRTARPGLPALAQGRRHRPQPDPRRPRHPLRPLVEPGRRGAGHRPGLPHRPDQARPGPPPHHRGHDRGPHRRAARPASGPWPTRCWAAARRR